MRAEPSAAVTRPRQSTRRLKPEVAARWAARREQEDLQALYQTPVERLSPEEIARMKAAFLSG